MPAKGGSSGRLSGTRGGRQTTAGAAKAAWKQLPGKAKKQIVQGTAFNAGVGVAAGTGFRKSKASTTSSKNKGGKGSSGRSK